jgi:hypothetical protein
MPVVSASGVTISGTIYVTTLVPTPSQRADADVSVTVITAVATVNGGDIFTTADVMASVILVQATVGGPLIVRRIYPSPGRRRMKVVAHAPIPDARPVRRMPRSYD